MQGTRSYGIHYAADYELELVRFTYSDWAGDSIDRKSTSGYVFMFGGGPIFWSIKNQASISLSSIELGYRGALNACIQAVWLQGILSKFDIGSASSTVIFCDNQSDIKISIDLLQRQRTKNIEIHMHYIKELVHDGTIHLLFCSSSEQVADIFTKAFCEKTFSNLKSLLGIVDHAVKA